QKANRPIGLRLENEPPAVGTVEFERGAQQSGQRHGFSENAAYGLRIIVPVENAVDHWAEAHQPSEDTGLLCPERHDQVICRLSQPTRVGEHEAFCHSILPKAPCKNCFLCMEPVFSFVEHDGLRSVNHFRADLVTAISRKAMHEYGVLARLMHQLAVDGIWSQDLLPPGRIGMAH